VPSGNDGSPNPGVDGAGPVNDSSMSDGSASDDGPPPADGGISALRGIPFPAGSAWVSFYGDSTKMGDLAMVAQTFRLINIDVDPTQGNFTAAQVTQLKASGQNRVISYLNVGACENSRDYWNSAPAPYVSCSANQAAQLSQYQGYPSELWMDVGNADYQRLIVEYVAPRLAAVGVDGFFIDNLEVVENTFQRLAVSGNSMTPRGCDATCSQGGLDLIRKLRTAFPDMLIVMQNATSDVTRLGTTGGVAFPSLLDGISHEDVYDQDADPTFAPELANWKSLNLMVNGNPFWISTEDYGGMTATGTCPSTTVAQPIYVMSKAAGYSPYVTDASAGQNVVCYWPF
jgi:cysteinyl-tRNA synthetase